MYSSYSSSYDSGLSSGGALLILGIILIVGLVISFFIIRYASRANELVEIQKKALQELKIQTAILSGDSGNTEVNAHYLDEIRKIKSADILERSGSVSIPNTIRVAEIYNKFMTEIETKNLSVFSAKKAFESEIDRITNELSETQKVTFLDIYKKNK
ncbi:YebO family protein [Xenorhabdus stockiae]|uniref:YebO family protein n=1 Tax=Xenorhabdus stockiae TaxID=351614 RepID=UPI003CF08278